MTAADTAYLQELTTQMQSRKKQLVDAALAQYNELPGPEAEAVALLKREHAAMTPEQLLDRYATGDAAIVCPNCHRRGGVITKRVRQKKGISGGKATGALLTGGLSMLGTGLSRKETATEFRCTRCVTTWYG